MEDHPTFCHECIAGTFLFPGTMTCLLSCPTGYLENLETSECDLEVPDDGLYSVCFEFNNQIKDDWYSTIDIPGETEVSVMQMGSKMGTVEFDDPTEVYRRGLYFDGVNDYARLNHFVLTISHTVEMWVHCLQNTGTLFSINKTDFSGDQSEEYYKIEIQPETVEDSSGSSDSTIVFTYRDPLSTEFI